MTRARNGERRPSASDAPRDYHLAELAIARARHQKHDSPPVPEDARVILDVGCGAGQTLRALRGPAGATLVGVDMDEGSLRTLERGPGDPVLAAASGEALPIATASCDLVISRVALPYMHMRTALGEMARVLRPGGTLWITLHPLPMILDKLRQDWQCRNWRGVIYQCFILGNGALFSLTGLQFRYPLNRNRQETFQTPTGVRRELKRFGLETVDMTLGPRSFVVQARRGASTEGRAVFAAPSAP